MDGRMHEAPFGDAVEHVRTVRAGETVHAMGHGHGDAHAHVPRLGHLDGRDLRIAIREQNDARFWDGAVDRDADGLPREEERLLARELVAIGAEERGVRDGVPGIGHRAVGQGRREGGELGHPRTDLRDAGVVHGGFGPDVGTARGDALGTRDERVEDDDALCRGGAGDAERGGGGGGGRRLRTITRSGRG
eukprot:5097766-Pleurochrysis_carterae.AAC.1